LTDVVEKISGISGLELLRISSLEPQLFTPELSAALSANPKVCPHFHIPLQSGSDSVLQRMGRHYRTELVSELVGRLNQEFPFVAIGMDVITGFPGETEIEHQQTVDFLNSLSLTYLHVFSYSKRKGTPAEKMPDQVDKATKNQRTNDLVRLSGIYQHDYRQKLISNSVEVRGIVESAEDGYSEFVSDHYLRVRVPGQLAIGSFVLRSLA